MSQRKVLKNIAKNIKIKTRWWYSNKKILKLIQDYLLEETRLKLNEICADILKENDKLN